MSDGKAPVFIRVEDYRQVAKLMEQIRKKLDDIDKALEIIREIKKREDSEIASWKSSLITTEVNINEIDKTLFEPEFL